MYGLWGNSAGRCARSATADCKQDGAIVKVGAWAIEYREGGRGRSLQIERASSWRLSKHGPLNTAQYGNHTSLHLQDRDAASNLILLRT